MPEVRQPVDVVNRGAMYALGAHANMIPEGQCAHYFGSTHSSAHVAALATNKSNVSACWHSVASTCIHTRGGSMHTRGSSMQDLGTM